ncbi:hypothetical protein AVEN_106572-1, partial [Araneus ventricosus]
NTENKLCDLQSVPDLFSYAGSDIDFVHSTPSENNDDSFISSLRTEESDQTQKKAREIVANRNKWKYNVREISHLTESLSLEHIRNPIEKLNRVRSVEKAGQQYDVLSDNMTSGGTCELAHYLDGAATT